MTHTQEIYELSKLSSAEWQQQIGTLPEREKTVLLKRCGQEIWTLKKLAEYFSVTPERIRQIENAALRDAGLYDLIRQRNRQAI